MNDDDAKRAILARRARFVAAALAATAGAVSPVACNPDTLPTTTAGDAAPQPCLSVVRGDDGATPVDATPQVCLSPIPPDSGPDSAPSDGSLDAPDAPDAPRDSARDTQTG